MRLTTSLLFLLLLAHSAQAQSLAQLLSGWTQRGPVGPTRVAATAVSPSDSRIVYVLAATDDGTIHRSLDGGVTWEPRDRLRSPLLDTQRGYAHDKFVSGLGGTVRFSLAVSPSNPDHVALCGINRGRFGFRLPSLVSFDGGRSWSEIADPEEDAAHRDCLAFDASVPGQLEALSNGRVAVTVDRGETWEISPTPLPGSGFQTLHRGDETLLLTSTRSSIALSSDDGVTFEERDTPDVVRLVLAAGDGSGVIWALMGPRVSSSRLYRTDDLGESWQEFPGVLADVVPEGVFDNREALDDAAASADSFAVIVNDVWLVTRSEDAWLASRQRAGVESLDWLGDELLLGTRHEGALRWSQGELSVLGGFDTGAQIWDAEFVAAAPQTELLVEDGFNGSLLVSSQDGAEWTESEAGAALIGASRVDPSTVYALSSRAGQTPRVLKSTDGGTSWQPGAAASGLRAITVDAQTPEVLYALGSGGELLLSDDGGSSFDLVGKFLDSVQDLASVPLRSDSRLFAVGQDSEGEFLLAFSDDRGETFTRRPLGGGPLSSPSLVVDPDDARSVYVQTQGDLVWTRNLGTTWRRTAVSTLLAIDRHDPNRWWLTRNEGLAYTEDQGASETILSSPGRPSSLLQRGDELFITVPGSSFPGVWSRARFEPSPCLPSATTHCLGDGRFRVEATWSDGQGGSGAGQVIELTEDTGAFWFFDDQNVELILKVLDGCSINDHFWIYSAGLTDVAVSLSVLDTESGEVWSHESAAGSAFPPLHDVEALPVCP